jgi:uncharacterized membrane protein YvbJ
MRYCTECGAVLKQNARFCNQCGTKVMQPINYAPVNQPVYNVPINQPEKSNKDLIINKINFDYKKSITEYYDLTPPDEIDYPHFIEIISNFTFS